MSFNQTAQTTRRSDPANGKPFGPDNCKSAAVEALRDSLAKLPDEDLDPATGAAIVAAVEALVADAPEGGFALINAHGQVSPDGSRTIYLSVNVGSG
jgi:hypothetical protein